MGEKTIQRGQEKLEQGLAARQADQVRLTGAGHPLAEKKTQR